MKNELATIITYHDDKYKPTRLITTKEYIYYVYTIEKFCLIVQIDIKRSNGVLCFMAKIGGNYQDYKNSNNPMRDGWVTRFGCDFEDVDNEVTDMLDRFDISKALDDMHKNPSAFMDMINNRGYLHSDMVKKAEKKVKRFKDMDNDDNIEWWGEK